WWSEHEKKGVIKAGGELDHRNTATTVRRTNGKMKVTDGPFIESKEHVGGYAVIEVEDLDAAIAVAKSWPGRSPAVEVRPVVER
ncbi:MAG TPA: YciI family protein, partial [Candidatus Limnocylindrales bacterium]|nr:YciI family protein [Candidatus Limnocylindrales bacterium]